MKLANIFYSLHYYGEFHKVFFKLQLITFIMIHFECLNLKEWYNFDINKFSIFKVFSYKSQWAIHRFFCVETPNLLIVPLKIVAFLRS